MTLKSKTQAFEEPFQIDGLSHWAFYLNFKNIMINISFSFFKKVKHGITLKVSSNIMICEEHGSSCVRMLSWRLASLRLKLECWCGVSSCPLLKLLSGT